MGGKIQYTQNYTYNADGVQTEYSVTDEMGGVLARTAVKPVGSAKSPEQLLVQKGLPYRIPDGTPWTIAEGGIGTILEYYWPDADGKLTLQGSEKIITQKTNAKGYLTEQTLADLDGKNPHTITYTLVDCQ